MPTKDRPRPKPVGGAAGAAEFVAAPETLFGLRAPCSPSSTRHPASRPAPTGRRRSTARSSSPRPSSSFRRRTGWPRNGALPSSPRPARSARRSSLDRDADRRRSDFARHPDARSDQRSRGRPRAALARTGADRARRPGRLRLGRQPPAVSGLLAFEEEDAAIYFGRDDDIRRLIERL